MNELEFVEKVRRYSTLIGDDCAVIRPPLNRDLLFTTDFSIEGVHFKRRTSAGEVGQRALARSLSDIAAMGGTPLYCLVSLALAPWTKPQWIDEFYKGMSTLLRRFKVQLAGGDLSHAKQLVCDVMLCGSVVQGHALRRSGAQVGDTIYVSGPLGGWRHRSAIQPRIDLGQKLVGKATACMDISDGLALDLTRLCRESGVSAELESIPLLKGASIKQAVHDGEDYELLYTARPKTRVPGIRIGAIVKGAAARIRFQGKPLETSGYDHFQQRS